MDNEIIMLPLLLLAFALSIASRFIKGKKDAESKAKGQQTPATQQPTAVRKTPSKTTQAKPAEKKQSTTATPTVQFNDGHAHVGDQVEQYDQIVGSLGAVSTEGCVEMDGFRLISNDENFDADSGETNFNLNKVAQAMVLGEILDKPRFKNPYKR